MRWMALLLTLALVTAAAVRAGDPTEKKSKDEEKIPAERRIDPKIDLPESKQGKKDGRAFGVVINLDAKGGLAVGDRPCSLDELAAALAAAVEAHKEKDGIASTMPVLLRLDRGAPWQHGQWIMTVCAEQRVARLALAVKRPDGTPGTLDCRLPVDGELGRDATWIRVHIVARQEKPQDFGGGMVMKPSVFEYRLGDDAIEGGDALGKGIRKARLDAAKQKAAVRCELKAGHKVPVGNIAQVLGQFHANGLERVDFYGTQLPQEMARATKRLPYPPKNYVTR